MEGDEDFPAQEEQDAPPRPSDGGAEEAGPEKGPQEVPMGQEMREPEAKVQKYTYAGLCLGIPPRRIW